MASRPSPLSLAHHVDALLDWLREHHELPPFEGVAVLDTSDPSVRWAGSGWYFPATALRTAAEFSGRFGQYLQAGYGWINLSVYGVLGTTMIVGVELPRASVGAPLGAASVNYSGPGLDARTGAPVWKALVVVEDGSA